ncbi:unannotated protein [freshwater metagenome]|uniref:Unannotated protein n=1 Tax=freshwater metagenome TaxID=449393 RepID=A0A6J6RTS9_9ZZZZ
MSASMASATWLRISDRARGGFCDQSSNAAAAAFTAASTSALSLAATSAITSAVAGFITESVAPLFASTHLPPM